MLGLLLRVKFLVMSDKGPVAETEWSNDTRLLQGMEPDGQVPHSGGGPGEVRRTGPAPSVRASVTVCRCRRPSPSLGVGGGSGGCSRSPLSGQITSLSACTACLPAWGSPHAPQLRCSGPPQGPRARVRWSSLPSCPSCWLCSSPPSLPCSSTAGKWTGPRPPGPLAGESPDLDRLYPLPLPHVLLRRPWPKPRPSSPPPCWPCGSGFP